jgi:leucyl aminopeptidase
LLVSTITEPAGASDADTVAVGLLDGEPLDLDAPEALLELLDSGEARASYKSLALAHAEGKRWLLAGLGKREELSAERLRVAAALAHKRALELATRALCWQLPSAGSDGASPTLTEMAAAVVEGTMLADYRFDRFKSSGEEDDEGGTTHLERLVIAIPADGDAETTVSDAVRAAAVVGESVNRARDLQNRPANDLTPTALAQYARELAGEIETLSVEVEGREGILARGMGAFAAVAQGSEQEPAMITLHYQPRRRASGGGGASEPASAGTGLEAPTLGLVGKAITFDSGGISLKPGAKMSEMKFDMSGGAAVIEAIAAIARLELPIRIVGVVGATENLPSGRAVKPGDIVTASNGKTVEVNNTDAEGRLVLADCLGHAIWLGAERVVDLATLTGAVIIALGSTYAGLVANDDELAERVIDAGERTGEIVWRLPLHEEYDALVKGTYGDIDNAPEERKAGTIVAATFLSNFVDDVPWAHLDIAGSAWDLGRTYAAKGAAGYGVRLLVELARSYCARP